jgi:hypothetical protein
MSEPKRRPRLLLLRCLSTGGLVFGFLGAVGGYTGVFRSEYQQSPRDEAIIVGIMGLLDGLFLGLVIGGLVDILRWWLWKRTTQD